jgi:hypothetical protein
MNIKLVGVLLPISVSFSVWPWLAWPLLNSNSRVMVFNISIVDCHVIDHPDDKPSCIHSSHSSLWQSLRVFLCGFVCALKKIWTKLALIVK